MFSKGLAVYFYPEWNRSILVIANFTSEKNMYEGESPVSYQIWDDDTRLDKQDDTIIEFPSWDEVKTNYVEFF